MELACWGIEPGESPSMAIIREVFEETGLHVRIGEVAGIFGGREFRQKYPNGDQVEFTVVVFRCIPVSGELRGMDGETVSLRYLHLREMPPLATKYPIALFEGRSGLFF